MVTKTEIRCDAILIFLPGSPLLQETELWNAVVHSHCICSALVLETVVVYAGPCHGLQGDEGRGTNSRHRGFKQ